jgi:hypothetical protein
MTVLVALCHPVTNFAAANWNGGFSVLHMIENLSQRVGSCVFISVVLFLAAFAIGRSLLNALFRMHKSKSMVRKLYDKYSFWQKMSLLHIEEHCEHAVKFCRGLILLHKISVSVFGVYVLTVLLYFLNLISAPVLTWFSLARILVFDAPVFVIDGALTRPFFAIGRRKYNRKYSFEKYHNSNNYTSLM